MTSLEDFDWTGLELFDTGGGITITLSNDADESEDEAPGWEWVDEPPPWFGQPSFDCVWIGDYLVVPSCAI